MIAETGADLNVYTAAGTSVEETDKKGKAKARPRQGKGPCCGPATGRKDACVALTAGKDLNRWAGKRLQPQYRRR